MKNFLFKDRDGQTPLPPELQKGLKPVHIQTIGELDEYEEQNIVEGLSWLKNYDGKCTTYEFWLKLHKKLIVLVAMLITLRLSNLCFLSRVQL